MNESKPISPLVITLGFIISFYVAQCIGYSVSVSFGIGGAFLVLCGLLYPTFTRFIRVSRRHHCRGDSSTRTGKESFSFPNCDLRFVVSITVHMVFKGVYVRADKKEYEAYGLVLGQREDSQWLVLCLFYDDLARTVSVWNVVAVSSQTVPTDAVQHFDVSRRLRKLIHGDLSGDLPEHLGIAMREISKELGEDATKD